MENVLRWPQECEAQERGCTCTWWGGGSIVEFDPACPILAEHRNAPESMTEDDDA